MSDLKFAFRQLLKNPGFTAVAVLTLALGIGANTAIFSVLNAVLLRPLPYPESDRLVSVCENNPRQGWDQYVTSMGAYAAWRRQNSVFQELAAATVLGPATMAGQTGTELVRVSAVSANFFALLGIQPILGRPFVLEEESPERGNVVLIGEALWRERFAADPGILNQSIRLGDRNVTVVGVMPASVRLFDPAGVQGWENGFSKSDLWRPLPVDSGLQKQRNYRAFLVLGRLKSSVSLAQAEAEMNTFARQQAEEYPDSNAGWSMDLIASLIPANVPRTDEISLDGRVLGLTLATSLVAGFLVGLIPLLAFWRSGMNGLLKQETRGSTGSIGGRRLGASLVSAQVALVMILLTGAGLLTRSFRQLNEVNPGFRPDHLVALDVSIGGPAFTHTFRRVQLVEQLLARLSDLPGLESSAAVDGLPLDSGHGVMDIALTSIEGTSPSTPGEKFVAGLRLASITLLSIFLPSAAVSA